MMIFRLMWYLIELILDLCCHSYLDLLCVEALRNWGGGQIFFVSSVLISILLYNYICSVSHILYHKIIIFNTKFIFRYEMPELQ